MKTESRKCILDLFISNLYIWKIYCYAMFVIMPLFTLDKTERYFREISIVKGKSIKDILIINRYKSDNQVIYWERYLLYKSLKATTGMISSNWRTLDNLLLILYSKLQSFAINHNSAPTKILFLIYILNATMIFPIVISKSVCHRWLPGYLWESVSFESFQVSGKDRNSDWDCTSRDLLSPQPSRRYGLQCIERTQLNLLYTVAWEFCAGIKGKDLWQRRNREHETN